MNYHFSKDYELLWELAQKQSIVCRCDFEDEREYRDIHDMRDVCETHICFGEDVFYISVVSRGVTYIDAIECLEEFIEQCKLVNLQFLIPGEVDELSKALRRLVSHCTIPEYLYDVIETLKKYEG